MARRLLLAFFTVWVITVLTFVIIQLPPRDSAERELMRMHDQEGGVLISEEVLDGLRAYLGLGQPQYIRYAKWMWNLAHGDLGLSFKYRGGASLSHVPVRDLIQDRLWLTIVLTGFTIIVTWTFAIPIGIYSAVRQHSVGDYAFTFLRSQSLSAAC